MTGLSRHTGREIDLGAHIAQSINDILTTPKGSRVLRRDYGSRLPDLIDAPMNGETLVDAFAETAEALDLWEPRLKLRRVQVTKAASGQMTILLSGEVLGAETTISTEVTA
jgi:phage baseplate assembly protein W